MLLAAKLHRKMDEVLLPEKLVNRKVSYSEFSKMLNEVLRPLGGYVRVMRDSDYTGNFCTLSGYYDTDLKQKLCIMVHVSGVSDHIKLTLKKYNTFRFMFSQIVQHEFIHRSQFEFNPDLDKRNIRVGLSNRLSKDQLAQINYLREWYEVEAYAHDIAMEIAHYHRKKRPETVLKRIDHFKHLESYQLYAKAFRGTDWQKLKIVLLKKTWKWLQTVKIPDVVLPN